MKTMQISFGWEYNIESSRAMSSHISYLSFFHTPQFEAKKFTLVHKFARKMLYKVLRWANNFIQPAALRVVCVEHISRKSSHFWGEKRHFGGLEKALLRGEKKLIESNRVRLGVRTSLAEKCCRSKNSSRTKVF